MVNILQKHDDIFDLLSIGKFGHSLSHRSLHYTYFGNEVLSILEHRDIFLCEAHNDPHFYMDKFWNNLDPNFHLKIKMTRFKTISNKHMKINFCS